MLLVSLWLGGLGVPGTAEAAHKRSGVKATERARKAHRRHVAHRRGGKPIRLEVTKVRPGDTLEALAYRFCTSPDAIARVNGLDPTDTIAVRDALQPGLSIVVPIRTRAALGMRKWVALRSGEGVDALHPERSYGRPEVVLHLTKTFARMATLYPDAHPALVGSLSKPGGGRIGHHKSHRAGRDVDIGYYWKHGQPEQWGRPRVDEIDYERVWVLIDLLQRTGHVGAIYMAPGIQTRLHAWASKHGVEKSRLDRMFQYPGHRPGALIRHEPGHADHFHVRFECPDDVIELSS